MINHKEFIKVALQLEAINKASTRQNPISYGYSSTLHIMVGAWATDCDVNQTLVDEHEL